MAAPGTEQHAPHSAVEDNHHVIPVYVYYRVFWVLMALVVVTLLAAMFDVGPLNLPIAMAIAIAKAAFIAVYFMHLKYSTTLVRIFAGSAFFWLMILVALTLNDYLTRSWLRPEWLR